MINTDKCVALRAVYDIGSSTTKFMIAKVDRCQHQLLEIMLQKKEGVQYAQDLAASGDLNFSNSIKKQGMEVLCKFKLYGDDFDQMMEYRAVATASFRVAKNAQEFVDEVNKNLAIGLRVISPHDEAKLAFNGVVGAVNAIDKYNIIVWDIGGGSMQMIALGHDDNFMVTGNRIAAESFKNLVLQYVKRGQHSPNPVSYNDFYQITKFAITILGDSLIIPTDPDRFDDKIYGVGSLHNKVVQHYVNMSQKHQANKYNFDSLRGAIEFLLGKSDDELLELSGGIKDAEFVKSEVTSLILVYAAMQKMGVTEIETLDVNNLHGLLIM